MSDNTTQPQTPTENPESVVELPNGDLEVTDVLGRSARLHWSRFHGLIVLADGAVYLGQPEVYAWIRENLPPVKESPDPVSV